ncbi:retinol dehydrogenase 12-like [Amphiura filiformis]|uniref:retinol dehydrogenase 12-like n=1 Tax=Amphiura filiformis TaxID=82378 RepID=UPI003B215195
MDFTRIKSIRTFIIAGIGCVSIYAWRRFIAGGRCYSQARLDGKTVIITGSNTGIGKETARELAKRGAKVILACRNVSKAQAAADDIRRSTSNDKVVVCQLDLSSLASIRNFAERVTNEEERLDVLVNNAGSSQTPRTETIDGFEMIIGTNHFGHFLLTNLLLDLLKKSSPSRIVTVSSDAYLWANRGIRFDDIHLKQNFTGFFAYGQSKLANILFTNELSKRLKGTGVTANVVHPGAILTELDRYAYNSMPLAFVTLPLLRFCMWFFGKTVVQGAQTSVYCAVEESIATTSGVYFKDCAPTKLKDFAQDEKAAKRLWDLSAQAVGLQ